MMTTGRLKGYNTDWIGMVRDLEESLEIRKKTFAILGAGGTARAAVFGILQKGGIPLIVNRTPARGERGGQGVRLCLSIPFGDREDQRGLPHQYHPRRDGT